MGNRRKIKISLKSPNHSSNQNSARKSTKIDEDASESSMYGYPYLLPPTNFKSSNYRHYDSYSYTNPDSKFVNRYGQDSYENESDKDYDRKGSSSSYYDDYDTFKMMKMLLNNRAVGSFSGYGFGHKCCPLVVKPLVVISLLGGIGLGTALLNNVITGRRRKRKRRSQTTDDLEMNAFSELWYKGRIIKLHYVIHKLQVCCSIQVSINNYS